MNDEQEYGLFVLALSAIFALIEWSSGAPGYIGAAIVGLTGGAAAMGIFYIFKGTVTRIRASRRGRV